MLLASVFSGTHASAVSTSPATVCVGATCTVSFPYTGDFYTWTVPASTTYTLEVWGSQGGSAGYNGTLLSAGGKGGYAKGNIALTAASTIAIYVGGQGAGLNSTSTSATMSGGWNGGGAGYVGTSTSDGRGSGGGGATDIRVNGSALSNRVIVAGGGAGGEKYSGYGTNIPGVGGGTSGGDGATANYDTTQPYNGKGGSSSAGGARGHNCGGVVSSTSGVSGIGGNGDIGRDDMGSAGAGGGYFGGGGAGCGMGAGGGSGYVGGVTTTTLIAGNSTMPDPAGGFTTGRTGDGYARITYTWGTATISLSLAGGGNTASKGVAKTINAVIDFAGKVTFYANGKKIPGCFNLAATVGTKTCSWKPNVQKRVTLTASIIPTAGLPGTSSPFIVNVEKRTGTRG